MSWEVYALDRLLPGLPSTPLQSAKMLPFSQLGLRIDCGYEQSKVIISPEAIFCLSFLFLAKKGWFYANKD
jgi:hypothetical protein